MPPKAKITKEMILDAAFSIVREEGIDKVTARRISERLNCSTQPVLYYFATVEEIKDSLYKMADEYHSGYIMNMDEDDENPMVTIGVNYIRFAMEERNLFRFLFQSDEFSGFGILDLVELEEIRPLLEVLKQELDMPMERVKQVFSTLFIYVHGYASLYANNTMVYEESVVLKALDNVFLGAVCALKGAGDEEVF